LQQLHHKDMTKRHRGGKLKSCFEREFLITLLSLAFLLSEKQQQFQSLFVWPLKQTFVSIWKILLIVKQSFRFYTTLNFFSWTHLCASLLQFKRISPQINCPEITVTFTSFKFFSKFKALFHDCFNLNWCLFLDKILQQQLQNTVKEHRVFSSK